MTNATDDGTVLSVAMGGGNITTSHSIYLDNIVLEEIDESELPKDEVVAQERNVNLLRNPEFANNGEEWDLGTYADGEAKKVYEDSKVTINVTNIGTEEASVNFKQENVTLISGDTYKINFDVKSTKARSIKLAIMTSKYDWYDGDEIELEADKGCNFEKVFTVNKDTAKDILFQLSLGKVGNTSEGSMIEISNVSLMNISEAPAEEKIVIEEVEGNLVTGLYGFGCGDADGKVDYSNNGGVHTFDIKDAGTMDWNVQLKQDSVKLEEGAKYRI